MISVLVSILRTFLKKRTLAYIRGFTVSLNTTTIHDNTKSIHINGDNNRDHNNSNINTHRLHFGSRAACR